MVRYTQTIVTPPAVEPVSAAEMRQWLKAGDDVDDDLIAGLVAAAREAAELYTGRAFITRTLKMTLDGFGGRGPWFPGHYDLPVDYFDAAMPNRIELPTPPVQSVLSVTTYDSANAATVYPAPNYRLCGSGVALNDGYYWPSSLRSCAPAEIVYVAGYGGTPADVPAMVRTAIKRHAQDLYGGVFGGGVKVLKAGDGTIEYFQGGGGGSSFETLLAPYRIIKLR